MRIEDIFPSTARAHYRYDFFKMAPPQAGDPRAQNELLDFGDVAGFEMAFSESYRVTAQGLAVTRYQDNAEFEMRFCLEASGLFVAGSPDESDHCAIPFPISPAASCASSYGTATVVDVTEDSVLVLETYRGVTEGSCTTRYERSAWIVWQEVATNRMQYVLRRTDPSR